MRNHPHSHFQSFQPLKMQPLKIASKTFHLLLCQIPFPYLLINFICSFLSSITNPASLFLYINLLTQLCILQNDDYNQLQNIEMLNFSSDCHLISSTVSGIYQLLCVVSVGPFLPVFFIISIFQFSIQFSNFSIITNQLYQGQSFSMSKHSHQHVKNHFNAWFVRLMYLACILLIAIYWDRFINIPVNYLAWTAVLWILNLYRTLNVDKTSIQNQFFIAFWVRMGWATTYSLYSTGRLYSNKAAFTTTIIECFIATAIYTGIPLKWVQKLWANRIYRWIVFFIDQVFANGHSFHGLLQKQIFGKEVGQSAMILVSKATARPVFQIITGFFNDNLFWNNLRKWSTICYLNSGRVLTLWLINYLVLFGEGTEQEQQILLRYFNICYYGFVGYLMYLETYTL